MAAVKTIKIEESIFADNDASAKAVREMLTSHHTTMLNVMSAPGSGKTTLLTAVIGRLSGEMKIRVMDVDCEVRSAMIRIAVLADSLTEGKLDGAEEKSFDLNGHQAAVCLKKVN